MPTGQGTDVLPMLVPHVGAVQPLTPGTVCGIPTAAPSHSWCPVSSLGPVCSCLELSTSVLVTAWAAWEVPVPSPPPHPSLGSGPAHRLFTGFLSQASSLGLPQTVKQTGPPSGAAGDRGPESGAPAAELDVEAFSPGVVIAEPISADRPHLQESPPLPRGGPVLSPAGRSKTHWRK